MVLTVQDRNRKISPRQFMKERLNLGKLQSSESFNHHGLEGYTAIASANSEYGKRLARIIVIYYGTRAYVIAGVAKDQKHPYQYDSLFLKSGHSFRSLRENEKQHSNARRLVVKTYSKQRYSSLAKKSRLNHLAESQIRLLNSDYPSGKPQPGELFKTIE